MKTRAAKATTSVARSVTTTIALPVEKWKALKIRAAQERTPLRAVCERAILAYLETPLPEEPA